MAYCTYLCHLLISVLALRAIFDNIIVHFPCVFYHYNVFSALRAGRRKNKV